MLLASTGTILLQAYELSQQFQLDISTAFTILYSASVGQVWIIRIITSLIIIGLIIAHYLLKKRSIKNIQNQKKDEKTITKFDTNINSIALYLIIIIVPVTLFSNSMVSHSNALKYFSSLAVSVGRLHFIAVFIWIGGLFYNSTTILKKIKQYIKDNYENTSSNINYEINNNINTINNNFKYQSR